MSQTIKALVQQSVPALKSAGVENGQREIVLLLRHITGQVFIDHDGHLTPDQSVKFHSALDLRLKRKPLSQIIGTREFYGLEFKVTPDVLDPRADSEAIIISALEDLDNTKAYRILDLGTGSGCLLLTLLSELPNSSGIGVDCSLEALAVAKENAERLNLSQRAEFIIGDWLKDVTDKFDIIVCNPPYISECEMPHLMPEVRDWEPMQALTPGSDGLSVYRYLAPLLPGFLNFQGRAVFEIGIDQSGAVSGFLEQAGFESVDKLDDLAGIPRALRVMLKK